MKSNESNSFFGESLRKVRKQRGYTMEQLAEISGISKRMIGHYETQVKRPALDKIQILAKALNVSANELMGPSKSNTKTRDETSYKIMKKVRLIEKLPTRDQNTIFSLINSLVEKNKLKGKI